MATNSFDSFNLHAHLRMSRKAPILSDARSFSPYLGREVAVRLCRGNWDALWEVICASESWLDDVSIECLLAFQLVWDVDSESCVPVGSVKDPIGAFAQIASDSDLFYILDLLGCQRIILSQANGGTSGSSRTD